MLKQELKNIHIDDEVRKYQKKLPEDYYTNGIHINTFYLLKIRTYKLVQCWACEQRVTTTVAVSIVAVFSFGEEKNLLHKYRLSLRGQFEKFMGWQQCTTVMQREA